ncbi:hypothetical protein JKF63_07909 [Porcisia hertigi]|uniref:Suppressive immunomodulating factor n=1 Tax=Porcisia hertigi TaxID=2761500 RepID=A0A836LJQ8_9TRYP|nr:hypothetical protein JKF63_07909 [Porcisia hertigi]
MSSLKLREIGVKNDSVEDGDVLELFAACRESVVHVAASHLLPGHVAVTTRSGFIQLIDTATGEFRLFLTYLDRIPLDASLRCLSLAPGLYVASPQQYRGHCQHHLIYSLSYSNELLLANVETGEVRLCAACGSRPSVVQCDGDYIVCGEGSGQVTVWRASSEEWNMRCSSSSGASPFPLPPLWRARFFDSTVVCANTHRDQVICCSADYRCVVASLEDGILHATLPLVLDQAVAVFALRKPSTASLLHKSLVICLRSRISVFTTRSSGDTAAAEQPLPSLLPAARHAERWTHQQDCVLGREEVACASCLGGYLAAGTISGLVILCACEAVVESPVRELVRFNVGYGVMGVQLFSNDTLLVVTSVGDVWRWPLCDLLRSANASGTEGGVDKTLEAEPMATVHQPPLPLAAPGGPPTHPPLDSTLSLEPRVSATPYELSFTQEGFAEDRNLSAHEISNLTNAPQSENEATKGTGEALTPVSIGGDGHHVEAIGGGEEEGTPSVRLSTASVSLRTTSVSSEDDSDEGNLDARRVEPATVPCLPPPVPPLVSLAVTDKSVEGRDIGTAARCATESQPRILYDPEQGPEEPEVVGVDVLPSTAEGLAGLSDDHLHLATSLTSTADTTACHDSASEDSGAGGPEVLAEGSTAGAAALAAIEGEISSESLHPFQTNRVGLQGTADATQNVHNRPGAPNSPPKDMKAHVEDLESEFAHAMGRLLGSAVSVEGLRKNRRMCPRKVAGVLANLTNQRATAPDVDVVTCDEAPAKLPGLEGPNSTKLLEAKRATLEAAVFDFEEYRQAHRLEVDALQYHHPVLAPTYTLQDRVFDAVVSAGRLCDNGDRKASEASGRAAAVFPAASEDELRDVTHGKVKWTLDPQIAEERRRGGPDMAQHHCDDLIFPTPRSPKGTVLFAEEAPLMPSRAWEEVLLLPLPLPPAPSVF